MLLKDNIQRLLKLGLGQAEFVLVKKIFRNRETLATSKQRLFFLRQCSTLNVFPKTIENLRLPYDFGAESITEKSRQRTKRFVLNESKRALRRIISIKLHQQQRLTERITSDFTPDVASKIRSQRYLAYNTASNLHNRKFLMLVDNLKNPSSANTSENNSPNDSSDQRNTTTNLNSTDNDNTSSSDNVTTNKPNLITNLTSNLNAQEINLLSTGPKFSLSPGISEHTIMGINIAFYRLANQIRWKHFRESRFQPPDFLTHPQSRHIHKPESEDELERKLQRIYHKLQVSLKELQLQRKWSNIIHAEKRVIKELKEKNYICLPSDKGTEFCIIHQDTYTQVALAHLNNSSTYQKVPRMSAKTVENKVNSTWKNVCLQNEIPSFVRKSFIAANTNLPRFYHLIKTHKTGPVIKIWPIVSNTNGPAQRLSWLLANALKPLLKAFPAHLENSLELIKCIQAGDFTTNKTLPYPCILVYINTHTRSHYQRHRQNSQPNIPPCQTRHGHGPPHSNTKQHVLLI